MNNKKYKMLLLFYFSILHVYANVCQDLMRRVLNKNAVFTFSVAIISMPILVLNLPQMCGGFCRKIFGRVFKMSYEYYNCR